MCVTTTTTASTPSTFVVAQGEFGGQSTCFGRELCERVLDGVRVFQEAVGVGDAALWAVHLVDRPRIRSDGEQRCEHFHHDAF